MGRITRVNIDFAAVDRVRGSFAEARYTVEGVRDLLGPVAGGALAREEIVPALRATAGGSVLEALTRLFWLQVPVAEQAVPASADLVALGLAERSGGELRALLHVQPLEPADGYAVSDLKVRPGAEAMLRTDHVVGTGGASANLAQLVIHKAVDSVLDLGTGCGVQTIHLASRAARQTATDLNPRALQLARLSIALSGISGIELLAGSLFKPVHDRRFDLIVSNPPFVVAPPGRKLGYRESGLPGDEVCRRIVTEAPARLTEDGWCQLLANWLHVSGQSWEERVGAWVAETGCDAWVVQRDVQDPAEYVELWLRDSCEVGSPEYRARYDAWLDYFEHHRAVGVGFGWITLRRRDTNRPAVRIEELSHPVDQPVGAYVENLVQGFVDAQKFSTGSQFLAVADWLLQEQVGPPGAPDPDHIVLRQRNGLRRAAGVGTVAAALAGVCDGAMPLDPLLDAIAQLMDLPPDQVRAHAETVLPELIADGFFHSAEAGD
jgi:methylase of polypeptide subunit release factors